MSPPRPYFRPLLVWIYAGVLQVFAVCLAVLASPFVGRRRAFWLLAPGYIRHVGRLFGVRPKMQGWEELPEEIRSGKQPAIFIANHASLFDPPLIISTLPCRPVFVAKQELVRIPVLGWVLLLAGFILIDRRNRHRAAVSLRLAARRIRAGQSIVVFPEGTRTRTGQLLPFKKGLFLIAWRAQVPVVPLGIVGGRAILPPEHWRVAPGNYQIRVGKPVHPLQFVSADALRRAMEQEVLLLSSEGK